MTPPIESGRYGWRAVALYYAWLNVARIPGTLWNYPPREWWKATVLLRAAGRMLLRTVGVRR